MAYFFWQMFFSWPNNRKPLKDSDKVPDHLKKFTLPFSQCLYKEYEEGEVLTQVIFGLDFSIWLHYFFMKVDTLVFPYVNIPTLAINYMRMGNIAAKLKGSGPVDLEGGKSQMLYVPANIFHEAILPKGTSGCLHINFHPTHLEPIAKQYPAFEPMLLQAVKKVNEGRHQIEIEISGEVDEELEKIINCKMGAGEREVFLQARIRDVLRMYCAALAKQQEMEKITNPEERILAKFEYYISEHLDKDLSLKKLSKYLGMSRTSLQKLVAKKYKKGIHKLIIEKRMKAAAAKLINTDDPVSNIAVHTTNMTFASFSTAFKKFHGVSPAKYRARNSKNRKK